MKFIKKYSLTFLIIFFSLYSLQNSALSEPNSTIRFENVTREAINDQPCKANKPFDVDFMDANNDGYYDLFAFSHYGIDHCLYLQNADGTNTFIYADKQVSNYSQKAKKPRGSSRATFFDLNGDKKEDFTSLEADTKSAVWINETNDTAFIPKFKTKTTWCGAHDNCNVGDINGDGKIDIAHNDGSITTYNKSGNIFNLKKSGVWDVFDLNSDSWPDLVDVSQGGYWKSVKGMNFKWVEIEEFKLCNGGRQHNFADFNNDGHIDIICSPGSSKTNNNGGSWFILKNIDNDQFINMSSKSGISKIGWKPYWSSYGNNYVADFNNDGLIDIVFSGSSRRENRGLEFLINKGDFEFSNPQLPISAHCPKSNGGCKPRVDVIDYDQDGLLDLLKMYGKSREYPVELYKNTTANSNNWIRVRIRGKGNNTDGLHTQLHFYESNSNKLIGHYQTGAHYDGRMKHIHAGLNSVSTIDIKVTWPQNGGHEYFKNLSSNQEIIISFQPEGSKITQNWEPGNGW